MTATSNARFKNKREASGRTYKAITAATVRSTHRHFDLMFSGFLVGGASNECQNRTNQPKLV
jgi:hypothetical protein